jgi:hypothetical protein
VDYALRALAKLRDEVGRTDWHAAFVGAGDTFEQMQELARELGLAEMVTFTGRIPDEDLLRYLSTADVCLSPDPLNPLNDVSTMNKIMEYMAMSRPIVSFELREARVSAGDAALYAPANDESEFAKLTSYLLDNPEERRRMGEIGRERVSGPLSWEVSKAALIAAYEKAVEGKPPVSGIPAQRRSGAGAGVAAPAGLVAPQAAHGAVQDQHTQVRGGVDGAHGAPAHQPYQGTQAHPGFAGPTGALDGGQLPVAPPDAHPPVEMGGDGPGRSYQ